jgi:hypothetical protein
VSWSRLGEVLQDWLEGIESGTRGGDNMDMRTKWKVKMARGGEYNLEIWARNEDEARAQALACAISDEDEIIDCEEEVP